MPLRGRSTKLALIVAYAGLAQVYVEVVSGVPRAGCPTTCEHTGERTRESREPVKERYMLWTLAVVLLALWALGLVSSYTMGGFIHLLLVIAIVVVLFRVIQGRRLN